MVKSREDHTKPSESRWGVLKYGLDGPEGLSMDQMIGGSEKLEEAEISVIPRKHSDPHPVNNEEGIYSIPIITE